MGAFITSWDVSVLLFIQEFLRSDFLDPVMKVITRMGNHGYLWIGLILILLIPKKTRKAAFTAAVALALCYLVVNIMVKPLAARIRPYDAFPQLVPLIPALHDYSFPSGHTANGFAVSLVFLRMLPKWAGVPLVVLNSLISVSRLYVGVHYPTDVIAGFLFGLLISQLVWYFMDGRRNRGNARLPEHV